jgi:hypothetical protein
MTTTTTDPAGWVFKLNMEFTEEEDGSATISMQWDETDPELDYWNSLAEEQRQKFLKNALYSAIKNLGISTDDT